MKHKICKVIKPTGRFTPIQEEVILVSALHVSDEQSSNGSNWLPFALMNKSSLEYLGTGADINRSHLNQLYCSEIGYIFVKD